MIVEAVFFWLCGSSNLHMHEQGSLLLERRARLAIDIIQRTWINLKMKHLDDCVEFVVGLCKELPVLPFCSAHLTFPSTEGIMIQRKVQVLRLVHTITLSLSTSTS